jgi:hypothetical protein
MATLNPEGTNAGNTAKTPVKTLVYTLLTDTPKVNMM